MSKIDLSKANIGDKFRTRSGCILEYVGEGPDYNEDKYLLEDGGGERFNFYKYGDYTLTILHDLDLVEQVFDKPLDELIEEATKQ